jgi:hypothetical protein
MTVARLIQREMWGRAHGHLKYYRSVLFCWINQENHKNQDLSIFPLSEKITECRDKWKMHLKRLEQTHIPLQAHKYCQVY